MPKEAYVATAILRLSTVTSRTGLARSTIYLRVAEGTFPKPIPLGGRAVGWIEAEVEDWLNEQISRSRSQAEDFGSSEQQTS